MHTPEEYQQAAFALTPQYPTTPDTGVRGSEVVSPATGAPVRAAGEGPTGTDARLVGDLAQVHTRVSSARPVPGEAWAEYILEAETRAAQGLPAVSPVAFAQMTDWGYRFPTLPEDTGEDDAEEMGSAYGPSFAVEATEAGRLADGPDGERPRFRQETNRPTKVVIEHTVFDARQERVARAMEMLTHSVECITTSEEYRAYLEAMARFHHYSANNVMLIWTSVPRQ